LSGKKELQIQRYISGEIEESSLLEQIKDAHHIKSSILPANLQNIYDGKYNMGSTSTTRFATCASPIR